MLDHLLVVLDLLEQVDLRRGNSRRVVGRRHEHPWKVRKWLSMWSRLPPRDGESVEGSPGEDGKAANFHQVKPLCLSTPSILMHR